MWKKVAIFVCCVALLQGCSQLAYYSQSIGGQLDIWDRQRDINEVIASTDDRLLKSRLQQAKQMRGFASASLALPQNGSYQKYADLQRDYVVWNVFATPEFSTDPQRWCFMVVGCVSYRGYFQREDAEAFADSLREKGMDVAVLGVSAYSTLGYFDDPLLNTFLDYPDVELAALIFHELSHQVVYIDDDTTFNESFATVVQDAGARLWLQQQGKSAKYEEYRLNKQRDAQVVSLLLGCRRKLQCLYDTKRIADDEKRRQKQAILNQLKRDYKQLKQQWPGYRRYDGLFARQLNNAILAPIGTYYQLVPAFERLLASVNNDFSAFYKEVKRIGALPKKQRDSILQSSVKE